MKNSELIAALQAFPPDMNVAILDYCKNADDDIGDGSSVGIYSDFEVVISHSPEQMADYAELYSDEPPVKPWVAIAFKNEEYEDDTRTCRICGCTDDGCIQCIEKTGEPCHWVEEDLCSACAPKILQPAHGGIILPTNFEG
jgi:hypothetical protein